MRKIYDPKDIEENLYEFWEKNKYFQVKKNIHLKNFSIIMPPPNITGNLHMGHAFQHTIMDILIRYHRMRGYNTLWQMGVDHAGIATQILVSRQIQLKYNKNLIDFGRKKFIQKCYQWKKKNDNKINYQIKRLGSSVDWSRVRFTLDDISKKGVKKVFIDLYNHGLIYRKKKISNWDITLKTVLSDLEIEHRSVVGNLWNIKYFLVNNLNEINPKKYLIVSTTRPETLLGDTAVAVHPDDTRYIHFIGSYVMVPIINRVIPVISDNFVDIKKGTGCVKISPAHDFNDHDVAIRKKLPMINIFTMTGNISSRLDVYDVNGNYSNIYSTYIPKYLRGLTRLQAREKILDKLKCEKLLYSSIKTNIINLYGERSGSEIECMLTNQWYLRTKMLSKEAIKVVQNRKITFFPEQYKNLYLSWMKNIQDWCISRQLWWGHRIPVWYDDSGNIYVGNNEFEVRIKYLISDNIKLTKELDVLDTWFSSSLWSFLSLDWPEKNNLLYDFHPTNVLVSGFDIIFFWVAKMIMMTMYCIKDSFGNPQIPFKNVYITGLIKDELGQKMSKSKGNVIDPLDIIDGISLKNLLKKCTKQNEKNNYVNKNFYNLSKDFPEGVKGFGADALRFTCSSYSSITRHINWDQNRLQGYRNFCNKIWHAGRFILININRKKISIDKKNEFFLFFDIWILSELNNIIKVYREALDHYRFDIATNVLYDFFWHKFCDWYLEFVKVILKVGKLEEIKSVEYTLVYIFEKFLRIAHPIIPFITEYIWIRIKDLLDIQGKTIMLQKFPIFKLQYKYNNIINIMDQLQKIILFLRKTRLNFKIHHKTLLCLFIMTDNTEFQRIVLLNLNFIQEFCFLEKINFVNSGYHIPENSIIETINYCKVFLILDVELNVKIKLCNKNKNIDSINKKINSLNHILSNKNFLKKAPKKIICEKKLKLKELIKYRNDLLQ